MILRTEVQALSYQNISAQLQAGLFQIYGPPPLGEERGHLSSLMKLFHHWPQSVKGAPMRQATRNPTPKLPKAGGLELWGTCQDGQNIA